MSLRLSGVVPLVGGLGLMCLAGRSLIADAIIAPSAPVLAGLLHLQPEKTTDLAQLAGDLDRSLAVQEAPGGWSALGLVFALEAETAPESDRPALADKAVASLRTSLRMAPANPYAWTRLAVVREAAGAQDGEVLRYLRLSWRTGPNEERLRPTRIDLALRHLPEVTPADRSAIFEDIRHAWASTPELLLPLARTASAANTIRAALVTDIGQLASFEKALAGTRH